MMGKKSKADKYDIDLAALSAEELRGKYRSLHASWGDLKRRHKDMSDWLCRMDRAVGCLATEGSVVFQAMAEKAGVRGHPSVSAVVAMFSAVSETRWRYGSEASIPQIEWPSDWDFDNDDEQSGDADMALNAPIDDAVRFLSDLFFIDGIKKEVIEAASKIATALQSASLSYVNQVKADHGFKPRQLKPVPPRHYREMERDDLIAVIENMGWMALDIAQELDFANSLLRRDLRATAYRGARTDLYQMSHYGFKPHNEAFDVKVLGDVEAE